MDIKDYVKQFNYSFDNLKSKYEEDFNSLYEQEKEWLGNLEDKVHLLRNSKHQTELNAVIGKLKSDDPFTNDDTKILSTFVSKVNTIVRIANRINNFKEETKLDNGSKLELYKFFNSVKNSTDLKSFNYSLNSNLGNFLPHIFSVIKHCQNPNEYPIYYKYWKNIIREVLTKNDDYDSVCDFYRTFSELNRHLNFATYLGTIGIQIAKNINTSGISVTNDSKEYKYLTKDVINIERYSSILDEHLNSSHHYFVVGAYWDGSNPSDQTERFIKNGIWENGYDAKFTEEVKAVPEGSKIAIKAAFTREKTKSVMAIKAKGTVVKNYQDGKKLDVNWEKEFTPFEVDFSGGYWATIKEVTKQDHIDQIFNHKAISDNVFLKTKMKFDVSIFENYIKFLRKINSELNLLPNDERVVYSVRDNRLNFTVGQRYSFNLYLNDSRGVYGVISKKKLLESSEPYDGSPPQPFYNYFNEFNPQKEEWNSINEAISDELNRTSKSGYRRYNNSDFENYVFELEHDQNANEINMDFPLNTILYGPPGTGKTYNTILRAAQIIENRIIESYDEALDIFRSNLHNQIEFITFHQNYSYEDFIQGLRPETDNKSSLVFDKKDGVFKKIADKALENLKLIQKAPDELTSEAKFDKALELFSDKVLESEDNFKINDTAYIFEVEEDAFRYTGEKWTNHANGLRMKFSDLKEFYRNNVKSRKDVKKLTSISGLANQHATYYFLVYSEILKLLPKKAEQPQKVARKNYVIIIDEINRANISRVFGELITLIEPDKRSHGTIPLEARLPSGDPFIVPSNLFIIGTMNTADKSIALLDIALRRRFEFESMYPKYEIKGQEIYDVEILKKINEQIIKSKGHDFQIGHAYFMGENKDLVQRMNKKVIPLLLEYYMNDEKEVKGILNSAGLIIEENSWPLKISGKND